MRLSVYFGLTTLLLISLTALLASAFDASVNSSSVNSSSFNSSTTACSDFDFTGIAFIICHNIGFVSNLIVLASANGNEDAGFWEGVSDSVQQYISDILTLFPAAADEECAV